ncbi:glycoside hydrolase family 17 protein [Lentinula edodes]|uniref:glucan endo-1,3-beta-D-glucosidase n=1 Tax=Lentinula edodes TaxID=5353 RepID=A0A1Q3E4U8_LENED|nr:glycoside hydrolase family 17 protein [Lentinula edodes]
MFKDYRQLVKRELGFDIYQPQLTEDFCSNRVGSQMWKYWLLKQLCARIAFCRRILQKERDSYSYTSCNTNSNSNVQTEHIIQPTVYNFTTEDRKDVVAPHLLYLKGIVFEMRSSSLKHTVVVVFPLIILLQAPWVHGIPQSKVNDNAGVSMIQIDASTGTTTSNCFPALGFTMPSTVPSSTDSWWCDMDTEYGFVGFSYEVTACQTLGELETDFKNIRKQFEGRYIRLYGACDNDGFYDDIIEAAWTAGIGVHALIWFGFDGSDEWMTRRDALFATLHSNLKAPFVTRVVQFGSEPLYDGVLSPQDLADQCWTISGFQLQFLIWPIVTKYVPVLCFAEMLTGKYRLKENNGAPEVIQAIDFVDAHMLPYFSQQASIANNSWPLVLDDLDWFVDNVYGKKIYLSENGWPSKNYSGVEPNSPYAVANVQNEHNYYTLLDSKCTYFKTVPGGGVGWFAHIYSDNMEPGYGIYVIESTGWLSKVKPLQEGKWKSTSYICYSQSCLHLLQKHISQLRKALEVHLRAKFTSLLSQIFLNPENVNSSTKIVDICLLFSCTTTLLHMLSFSTAHLFTVFLLLSTFLLGGVGFPLHDPAAMGHLQSRDRGESHIILKTRLDPHVSPYAFLGDRASGDYWKIRTQLCPHSWKTSAKSKPRIGLIPEEWTTLYNRVLKMGAIQLKRELVYEADGGSKTKIIPLYENSVDPREKWTLYIDLLQARSLLNSKEKS